MHFSVANYECGMTRSKRNQLSGPANEKGDACSLLAVVVPILRINLFALVSRSSGLEGVSLDNEPHNVLLSHVREDKFELLSTKIGATGTYALESLEDGSVPE